MLRKIVVIALREYNAAVRTKAFVVSLVFLPVLMLGSFGVQALLRNKVDTTAKHFAVIDHTEEGVLPALEAIARKRNETGLRDPSGKQVRPEYVLERVPPPDSDAALKAVQLEQSDRVRRGELAGIIEIGSDVVKEAAPLSPGPGDPDEADAKAPTRLAVRFQAHSHTSPELREWLGRALGEAVRQARCRRLGLDAAQVDEAVRRVPIKDVGLSLRDPRTDQIEDGAEVDRMASFLLPFGLVMMMFMMIFVGSSPLLQGVLEEKTQRIAEVLLGSVRPFPLMFGKLLGTVGVATTLAAVYLTGAYIGARHYHMTEYLSPQVMAWFVVYQTLGVLLFGSLFIAVGAACTSAQEAQTLLMPVMVVAMIPLFVLVNVITEPDGAMATGLSLFPTAAPSLMVARLALSPGLPLWQPLAGIASVLLATVACVWAAGRIFRVGLLAQGQGASFRELARWVWRG